MTTDAATHGHAAASGKPANGNSATDDARADRNQGRHGNGIASNLDCRIPACVAGGGEQDGREDKRIQDGPYLAERLPGTGRGSVTSSALA
jgi:hypothetical protein